MIKIKYNIDQASLAKNSDYDLSAFENIEITFSVIDGVAIAFINDKIVVHNKALFVDTVQKVEGNLLNYNEK